MILGNFKQYRLLAFFAAFALTSSGQTGRLYKYIPHIEQQAKEIIANDHSLIINYSFSELNLEDLINDQGTFFRIEIPGHIHSADTGKPEFPVLSRLIEVPTGYKPIIKISEVRSTRFRPSTKKIKGVLYPAQESEAKILKDKKPRFAFDKEIYASREFIGQDTVRIEPLGTTRGKNLANVMISPVRYNPHKNSIEVIISMKIEISFSPAVDIQSKALFPESPLTGELLEKGVLNYNPGNVITGYTDKPVRMVILTDTAFKKGLQPLIRWKTQKGFLIDVLYKGAGLAGNTYTALKDTLDRIYKSSTTDNPPPEFLLIIGNVSRIPYYGTGSVTDMYYGEFDGNGDYIPEMFIGRLPVKDTTELRYVVDKIIQYEKFEFADTNKFYSNALATAGIDAAHADYMNGQIKYSLDNYLNSANKITEFHFYSADVTKSTKSSIIDRVNKGISFLNYSGHGQPTGWLIHSTSKDSSNIYTSDSLRFRNKNMYPFIISNACSTSAFSQPSLGNSLVVSGNKGAIGFIGCADDSYWDEDFYWAVGTGIPSSSPKYETTGLGALDRMFHTHNESPSDWYITMGQINFAGNLSVSASTTSKKKYYWENYNLVGDPSIIPIIGTPGVFSTSLPDTLPNNIKSFSFNGDPFSYAAVSHFDTLWDASFLSPSGSVTLDMPGLSDDSCLFVITGQNKKPVIKKVYFSNVKSEFINLTKSGINDQSGNNNGLADFGETFSLKLTISNLGLTGANNLRALISTTSAWVTILNDSADIGTLGPGSEIILNNKLNVRLSREVPDKGIVTFDLILRDDACEKDYKIDMNVHAPELDILNYKFDDKQTGNGDFIADPGETFNLLFNVRNSGSSNTSGIFNVSSPDPELTVLEPGKGSGNLEEEKITQIPVMVKLLPSASSGTTISLNSFLNCDPHFVNRNFSFRVGRVRESFESATFNIFPWINVSPIPWTITQLNSRDGIVSARSGAISHNETSALCIKAWYPQADSLKFYYSVSSEASYDFLLFRLNDVEIMKKSGEIAWQKEAIPVKKGYNKMEWLYKKDQSVSSGLDCALIDMIDFTGPATVTYIKKDIITARFVTPVNKDNLGKEPVSLRIANIGRDTIRGFNMAYSINNSTPVTQHFDYTLIPSGDSVTVTFNTNANLSYYGNYNIVAYGYNNNDDYLLNDTVRVNIRNNELNKPLLVTPNPFRDKINIVLNSEFNGIAHFTLTNFGGTVLVDFDKDITIGTSTAEISGTGLAPGVYYLKVEFPGHSKTVHLVKIK